jgi:hypothetical protein
MCSQNTSDCGLGIAVRAARARNRAARVENRAARVAIRAARVSKRSLECGPFFSRSTRRGYSPRRSLRSRLGIARLGLLCAVALATITAHAAGTVA